MPSQLLELSIAHTLNVASTGNFAATGTFTVAGVSGTCTYTGKTATSFTGVTGCSGTPLNGATVTGPNQAAAGADARPPTGPTDGDEGRATR